MTQPIDFIGFGHICINVDNLEKAEKVYNEIFGAIPLQKWPDWKNKNWGINFGLRATPHVDGLYLFIPKVQLILELFEWHNPKGKAQKIEHHPANVGFQHISLRVNDIDKAFQHIKSISGIQITNQSKNFTPRKMGPVGPETLYFCDPELASSKNVKEEALNTVKNISFFTFIDPYGMVWEFEGSKTSYAAPI